MELVISSYNAVENSNYRIIVGEIQVKEIYNILNVFLEKKQFVFP